MRFIGCRGCRQGLGLGNKMAHLPVARSPETQSMPARAYWKGYLKLSLVTCPIALYPASSKVDKTHFHQINKKTGHRLRQQMVDEQTGRVVDKANKGRAYELSKGKFVEIEPQELE